MIRVIRHLKIQDLINSKLDVPIYVFLEKTNISRQTYYDFMSGKHRPTLATLNKVCNYFGVSNVPYLKDVI